MAAPLKTSKPMVRRNFFIDEATFTALTKIAHHQRRPVAELVREAANAYVKEFLEDVRAKKAAK